MISDLTPTLEQFRKLAIERRVIPVFRRFLADGETAIGLYRKLAANLPGTYLLESAEQGVWSRYSFVGVRAAATLTEEAGQLRWLGHTPVGLPTGGDPLSALAETLRLLHTSPTDGMPPFTSGMVGYLSYDAVRRVERLPDTNPRDLDIPELAFLLASDLAVLDHHDGQVWLVANAINFDGTDERVDEAYADAAARVEAMAVRLAAPTPSWATSAGFDSLGSSPEALVTVKDGVAVTHPIAGSKPRGATPAEDAELEAELRSDPKERAEHLMLVDLGRNDLGRVCEPGTVEVVEFMDVRRYSHIMHLESTVQGRVDADHSALDVVLAAFPAGTLSGAPKVRAMEIIDELEVSRRALYGGIVGYLDFAGNADAAIAIRTALLRDGAAYIQAGGGIVADSDPATEDQESQNKAAAVVRAISVAQTFSPLASPR